MVVASSASICSPQTQLLLLSDENEGAHSLQCPVSETVDSPRIIIADWADGRGKGETRYFTRSSRSAQWFVILKQPNTHQLL